MIPDGCVADVNLAPMAAHSFVWVRVHCVWTTYRRQPLLEPDWQERLYRYLSGVARRKGALLLCAGGVRDHIHLYLSLPPDRSIASLVNALKANSSRWIHATFPHHRLFAWQTGYAAFSVSQRSEQRLISYILNQEKHHNGKRFGGSLRDCWTATGCSRQGPPFPGHRPVRKHGAYPDLCRASSRSLKRWILPVAVFGSSFTNTIQRGYLYAASRCFTEACNSSANAGDATWPAASTTNASGLTSSSASAAPTTPASTTAGCSARALSTSAGDTHMPPALIMSSERPAYQKQPAASCRYLSPVRTHAPTKVCCERSCWFQ